LLLARITEVPCTSSKTRKCHKAEQLFPRNDSKSTEQKSGEA
jgi:hypothetical protein